MAAISTLTKDQLAKLAKDDFGVELDLRKTIDVLRSEVTKLQEKGGREDSPAPEKQTASHILNRNTGRWFPYSKLLADYLTNAVPCDENGKPV